MALSKLKLAVGVAVTAGLGTVLVVEHQARVRLREQNAALERQVAQLSRPAEAVPALPGQAPAANAAGPLSEDQIKDLARLRREVGALRRQPNDLPRLQAENRELRAATDEPDDPAEAEFQEQTQMRMTHLKQWGLSFMLYARDHADRYPETFEQAASIQGTESLLGFDTNHFEVVYRGTLQGIRDAAKTVLFRERQARRSPKGDWVKVYGLADGHVEAHTEADVAGFEAWEKDRVVARP